MHWLYLLLALAAMVFAMKTTSTGLMFLGMLAALVLLVLWLAGMYAARVAGRSRDVSAMIDPAELRRLREQAEARKAAARDQEPPAP
jgi:Sec-independent protein secretion pathway component TatC